MNLYRLIALIQQYDLANAQSNLQDVLLDVVNSLTDRLREGEISPQRRRRVEGDICRLQELSETLDHVEIFDHEYND